jgi:hypothetical protein
MSPSAKVVSIDPKNVRGRARRWQGKAVDPVLVICIALVIALVIFGFGILVGYLASHTPISAVQP